nr:uncharacterized protein LOC117863865 isoform X1 [Setaria viridis]
MNMRRGEPRLTGTMTLFASSSQCWWRRRPHWIRRRRRPGDPRVICVLTCPLWCSQKKRKTEAEKKTGDPPAPALTPETRARYKELAGIIKGFLKELGDDVDEVAAAAGGSTSQAAPPPPAAAGDKQ